MSAAIEIGYSRNESGDVSVSAVMLADEASPTELAYAKQAMVYIHRMLDTNLDHLNLPRSIDIKSKVLIGSDIGGDDDEVFDATFSKNSTTGESTIEPIGVKFESSTNFSEIGCMNQVHNVIGKATFDMLCEAIKSVAV